MRVITTRLGCPDHLRQTAVAGRFRGDRDFREALAIALRLEVEGADELLEAATRRCDRTVLTCVHAALVSSTARRNARVEILPKPFGAEALVGAVARSP